MAGRQATHRGHLPYAGPGGHWGSGGHRGGQSSGPGQATWTGKRDNAA